MKKGCLSCLVILLLVIVFVAGVVPLSCYIYMQTQHTKPVIRQAEFPFSFTYTENGETHVYEDVLVCEYKRIGWGSAGGYACCWNGKLKYHKEGYQVKEEIVYILLYEHNDGEKIERIYAQLPAFWYCMGDEDQFSYESYAEHIKEEGLVRIVCSKPSKYGTQGTSWDGSKQAKEWARQQGVELISYSFDTDLPIENEFR